MDEKPEQTICELISPWTGVHVTIVGTAHVSKESANQVKEVIAKVQPGLVILELCASRQSILAPPQPDQPKETMLQLVEKIKTSGVFPVALAYFYSSITEKLSVAPGLEFRAAYEAALEVPDCRLLLGDRPVQITLKRTWAALGLYEKLKLIAGLIRASWTGVTDKEIEALKDNDLITAMMKELAEDFPGIVAPLVDERDQWLACMISRTPAPLRVVAVVGMAHLDGIKKYWDKPVDLKALSEIPETTSWKTTLSVSLLVCLNAYIVIRMIFTG